MVCYSHKGQPLSAQAPAETRRDYGRWSPGGRHRAGDVEQHFEAGRVTAMKYLVVVEKTDTGFSAYSPDLPGCIATGATREEIEQTMRETMEFHLEGMRLEGHEPPQAASYSANLKVFRGKPL